MKIRYKSLSLATFLFSAGMALAAGPTSTSLGLNGSQGVTIADAAALDLTTNYTLEAWIYPTSTSGTAGIISKYHTSAADGYFVRLSNAGTGIEFDGKTTASGIIQTNKWYHIAAVNSNGTRTLYINGDVVALTGTAQTTLANSDPLMIGTDFTTRYFTGNIDEVRIYNTARTQEQIWSDRNSGTTDGALAYYKFDNASFNSSTGSYNGAGITSHVPTFATNIILNNNASLPSGTISQLYIPYGSNVTISNDLTITSAVEVAGRLNWGAGVTITAPSVTTTNYGYINSLGGTFNGSLIFNDISGNSFIGGSVTSVTNNSVLYLADGTNIGSLTNASNKQLGFEGACTIGNLTNHGEIKTYSTYSLSSSQSLKITGTHTNTGTEIYEQFVNVPYSLNPTDKLWHHVSSPVISTDISTIMNQIVISFADFNMKAIRFNESSNTWTTFYDYANSIGASSTISNGDGWLFSGAASNILRFSGTFRTGNVNKSVAYSGAGKGYNVVGNPYTSYIDLEAISRTNVGSTIWIWDSQTQVYSSYQIGVGGTNGGSRYVAPCQSFFVKATATGASVGFTPAAQTHSSASFKSGSEIEKLSLKIHRGKFTDELLLTNAQAENDGYKFSSMNPSVPQISIAKNNAKYTIYNSASNDSVFQINFKTDSVGKFKFSVSECSFGKKMYLHDKITGQYTLLKENSEIEFTRTASESTDRFELLLKSGQETTNFSQNEATDFVTTNKNADGIEIAVINGNETTIVISDLLGQNIASATTSTIASFILTNGMYIISASQNGVTKTNKVSISK